MMRRALAPLALAVSLATLPALADDVTGADKILCSASDITVCFAYGVCEVGTPEELNVPQFIEIDLAQKRLATTKASGLNRSSVADTVRRAEGSIVIQGFEKGRGYSFVVDEKTGTVTVAVAAPSRGVTAFGVCTPLPSTR